ncbi:hypothetical protein [Oleiharenicola sp. Vm1]|uniref:hypothetical protein n=1 Tax=Oleiharenicola sp. Vm1 TaxID=3398393 RepID=UPI0039F64649
MSALIPAGTEMMTVGGDRLGVFDAPTKAILYRTKRRGRWRHLAQVEGVTVERFEPSIGTQATRRVYVSWAVCKLERAPHVGD